MPLTLSQLRAIQHKGANLQLIACAGSGKTEVVARRACVSKADRLACSHLSRFMRTRPITRVRNRFDQTTSRVPFAGKCVALWIACT